MRNAFVLVVLAVIVLSGCSVKTPSILPENKGKGIEITQPQLVQEAAELDKRIASGKAEFKKAEAENAASLEQMFAEIQAQIDYKNTVVPAANADLLAKQEQRNYVFETVSGSVAALVPPPYAAIAALAIGVIGAATGIKKTIDAARDRRQNETAKAAVGVLVQAIKAGGAVNVATNVDNAVVDPATKALIAETVDEQHADIL